MRSVLVEQFAALEKKTQPTQGVDYDARERRCCSTFFICRWPACASPKAINLRRRCSRWVSYLLYCRAVRRLKSKSMNIYMICTYACYSWWFCRVFPCCGTRRNPHVPTHEWKQHEIQAQTPNRTRRSLRTAVQPCSPFFSTLRFDSLKVDAVHRYNTYTGM